MAKLQQEKDLALDPALNISQVKLGSSPSKSLKSSPDYRR
jgi:hypothetical protein